VVIAKQLRKRIGIDSDPKARISLNEKKMRAIDKFTQPQLDRDRQALSHR
jgi:hypothetical protein